MSLPKPETSRKLLHTRSIRVQSYARDDGLFAAETLALALRDVDIDEVVLELRSETIEIR